MTNLLQRITLFLTAVIFSVCGLSQTWKPVDLKDGISVSDISPRGMKPSVLNDLTDSIRSGYFPNIHSLLIYKDGYLIYESYFPGKDQNWGEDLGKIEHGINDLHDMRSISKSIVSACIGIAVSQGKIKGPAQHIFDFFPEYANYDTGLKKTWTIKHLLTMTSGLKWNEDLPYVNPENSEIQMTRARDPVEYVISQPLISAPGTEWKYNGGTTQLLSIILERATGKKLDEFAREFLFVPLGIPMFEWVHFPGTKNPAAASGLRLRSRDLMKFALLYQKKGNWKGKQIVSAGWISESLKASINRPGDDGGYGYQFWIIRDTIQGIPVYLSAAVGNGDQRIYFDEQNHLIVVVTSGNYNLWDIENDSYAILKQIYTSFRTK